MRALFLKACALLLVLSGAVWAQGSPLTFDQLVELAQRQNPVVDAQEASLRVSHALISQAGAGPNPVLQLQSQADGLERLSSIGLAVSKPFELGHKRAARIRAAELSLVEAESEKEERLHLFHFQLQERFLALLLAQARQALAEESLAIIDRHLAIAKERLAAGDISGAEVSSLTVERERYAAKGATAQGETEQATALLGEFLSDPAPLRDGVSGELGWRLPLPTLESLLDSPEGLVGLRVAQARVAAREGAVGLERANGVSDLTVQAGVYVQRVVYPGSSFQPVGSVGRLDDTGPMLQLQLQIPLPLNNDNSGNIAAAQARQEQARFETEALRRKLRAEITGLYRTLLGRRQARQSLEELAKPAAQQTLATVERAYSLGFRSQIDLLLARQSYLETCQAALDAAHAESLTAAQLEHILGTSLTTKDTQP